MKKKIIITLLAIAAVVCCALGLSACAKDSGDNYNGTYYLFEDEQYIEIEYYTLDGGNWSDAHNMGGTYEIKDGVISFYIDLFNKKTLWQEGTIGNGKLTLEGFSGTMIYYKKGMAHVHSFSEWQIVIEPDCTRAGEQIRACECGETERKSIPALGHDLTKHIVYIPATCRSGGKMSKTCDRCGQLFEEDINKDPNAHYIEEGKDETTCSGCGTELSTSFSFKETYNGVQLTEGDGVNVIVPAVYHGKPVMAISYRAFHGCTSLISITIPYGVTYIGESAFNSCTSLESITIPDSVTSIGDYAFSGCTSLESITIPDGVTSIGDYAFSGCTSLESITIPDGVTSIGVSAFRNCTSLKSVNFGNNSKLETIGRYAFEGCTSLISIAIPDGVTSIKDRTFFGCKNLTSITIPHSVTSIASTAFTDCTQLIQKEGGVSYVDKWVVGFDDSINTVNLRTDTIGIADSAFYNCTRLTNITIPDSVTSIGDRAFEDCDNIVGVYITDLAAWCNINFSDGYSNPLYFAHNLYLNNKPLTAITAEMLQGVTEIKDFTFLNHTSLESITIPDGITSIGYSAFNGCTKLTSLTIPDSVNSISDHAFGGCKSLESVNFGNDSKLETIGYRAFLNCTSLKSVNFGNNSKLETIGEDAFRNCTSLKSVNFGNNSKLETIGRYAFDNCTSLTSITIPDSVTSIGFRAFWECASLESVTFTNKNGWMIEGDTDIPINVDNAAQNAEYLKDTYYNYYWKREG